MNYSTAKPSKVEYYIPPKRRETFTSWHDISNREDVKLRDINFCVTER